MDRKGTNPKGVDRFEYDGKTFEVSPFHQVIEGYVLLLHLLAMHIVK